MHNRLAPLAAAALALASAGCSQLFPTPVSGPQSIVVLTYDPSAETYSLGPETITTLHDLRTMQGAAANIYANATVNADYATLSANPPGTSGLQAAVVPNGGQSVDFDYFTVGSGIYPADADALNVATAYYEIETAYLFFQGLSLQLQAPVPTYYFPTLSVSAGAPQSVTDLGTTDPWLGVFVIPAFSSAGWEVPALQPGVVAYEYSQAVFAEQVFGAAGPTFLDTAAVQSQALAMTYAPTINIIRSLNAALADFFAAIIVGDPSFVHTSGATVDMTRTLLPTTPRCISSGITNNYMTQTRAEYDPHPLGSIISAVLYDSWSQPNTQTSFQQAIGSALAKFGAYLAMQEPQLKASPLTLENVADQLAGFVATTDAPSTPRLCAMLIDRLGLNAALLTNCTDAITLTGQTCANSQ